MNVMMEHLFVTRHVKTDGILIILLYNYIYMLSYYICNLTDGIHLIYYYRMLLYYYILMLSYYICNSGWYHIIHIIIECYHIIIECYHIIIECYLLL
jgi:hypothetical protein